MKILQFIFCVLGFVALSGCTNTWEGMKRDARESNAWAHHQPSTLDQSIGPAPTGYARLSNSDVVQPLEPYEFQSEWHETAPQMEIFEPVEMMNSVRMPDSPYTGPVNLPDSILYDGGAVSVFPVDDESEVYEEKGYDYVRTREESSLAPAGDMAEQIFFAYGSARVGTGDRARLRKLAANLNQQERAYRLNIVGHASKRVDHVKDPLRKKMINFEMAQQRASAVTQALRDAGAEPDWVMATSRGDNDPNPNPGMQLQEAADRRAEVYVDNP